MLRICLLIFFFLSTAVSVLKAQDDAVTNEFSVHEIKGNAYLYWVLAEGSSCNGIGVERSGDGIVFTEIGDIVGVCGNVSFPTAFDYTDTDPVTNKISYYRLRLGNGGYSSIVSINIISVGEDGYMLYPNPASTAIRIQFKNESGKETSLIIYDSNGRNILQSSLRSGTFDLDVQDLSSGVYTFQLLNESVINGRFMIVR